MGIILEFLAKAIIAVAQTIFRGYVFVRLWAWFITPTFGLKPLKIVPAIGITLLVSFLVMHGSVDKWEFRNDLSASGKFWMRILNAIITTLMFFVFGWIIHLYL